MAVVLDSMTPAHRSEVERKPLEYTHGGSVSITGFWLFMATDLLVFACLFATYVIIRTHTAGGPTAADIFDKPPFITETFALLTSSFTCGLATFSMRLGRKKATLAWLAITMLLGLTFIGFEVTEFAKDVANGATMSTSAFLSAFFTLVGTHGCHVSLGILWMASIFYQITRRGLDATRARKLFLASLYWHFLDIVWVFIFTIVYTMGVM